MSDTPKIPELRYVSTQEAMLALAWAIKMVQAVQTFQDNMETAGIGNTAALYEVRDELREALTPITGEKI